MTKSLQIVFVASIFGLLSLPPVYAQDNSPLGCPATADSSGREIPSENSSQQIAKIVLDRVDFDGPTLVSEPERQELRVSLANMWFHGGGWTAQLIESIRSFWQQRGYFWATVSVQVQPASDEAGARHFNVVVHVDEGKQYRLENIRFVATRSSFDSSPPQSGSRTSDEQAQRVSLDTSGADSKERVLLFPEEELRSLIPVNDGDIFAADSLRQGLLAVQELYRHNGYLWLWPESEFNVIDERQTISVRVLLDQGWQYHYGKVTILGLSPGQEESARSEMPSGAIFDARVLQSVFARYRALIGRGTSQFVSGNKTDAATVLLDFRPCPQD